jgi:hypothetical protein
VLTVVREDSPDKFGVAENVPTQKGARTMALDSKTHQVYTVTAKFGPPPAPTAAQPHPRPTILPDSFVVLILGHLSLPVSPPNASYRGCVGSAAIPA